MARPLSVILADIDALKGNMATGALSVQFTDHSVTFRRYEDMRRALTDLEAEAAIARGGGRIRRVRFATGKGL